MRWRLVHLSGFLERKGEGRHCHLHYSSRAAILMPKVKEDVQRCSIVTKGWIWSLSLPSARLISDLLNPLATRHREDGMRRSIDSFTCANDFCCGDARPWVTRHRRTARQENDGKCYLHLTLRAVIIELQLQADSHRSPLSMWNIWLCWSAFSAFMRDRFRVWISVFTSSLSYRGQLQS